MSTPYTDSYSRWQVQRLPRVRSSAILYETDHAAASKLDNFGSKERNVLLVYYLGSVTLMVVAALRHLSRLPVRQYRRYD
ncbi:hypothetical protein PR003_g26926 [Phytophthora rubi]|uniref:Uncharacterized protein n=1 Tax=Phytophthora rubi TaxID=129364 RepID=A0A6A4C6P7_9STRA|nr:hypothetical protein PR003_g26926 [Phytophthora rubi]